MGPEIFLVVMICSNDPLTCDNRSSETAFAHLNSCRAERAEVIMARSDHDQKVFARCQYVLTHESQNRVPSAGSQVSSSAVAWWGRRP